MTQKTLESHNEQSTESETEGGCNSTNCKVTGTCRAPRVARGWRGRGVGGEAAPDVGVGVPSQVGGLAEKGGASRVQGCAGMWRRRDAGPETPPASQQQPSAPPGGSGRRAATPWDSAPPSRWAPSSPGTGRPATAAGPSLSGDPAAAGPLASAAASTGVDLTAQAALASATRGPLPAPTCPPGASPCPRAPPAGRRERAPFPPPPRESRPRNAQWAPSEHAQHGCGGGGGDVPWSNSASPGLLSAARSWGPDQSALGGGDRARERGGARPGLGGGHGGGASVGRTCGLDWILGRALSDKRVGASLSPQTFPRI